MIKDELGRIRDESGNVAMVRKQPVPKQVTVGGNRTYVFTVNRNISFAWVQEQDVDKVLAVKGCNCGGRSSNLSLFRIANDQEYRIWHGIASR